MKTKNHTQQPEQSVDKAQVGTVEIRMYCMGTGDCLVLRFFKSDGMPYVIMIDCGSCRGDQNTFKPYIKNLAKHVKNTIDLLIVTHEHQDHVNGFQKCRKIFEGITIKNLWLAWTENPDDPTGQTGELLKKRSEMKTALKAAMQLLEIKEELFQNSIASSPFADELKRRRRSFIDGLQSLAEVNLDAAVLPSKKKPDLPGMAVIKEIAKAKGANISYLMPGTTVQIKELEDINFHILGPPVDRTYIYKDGKEGRDIYRKTMDMGFSSHLAKSFSYGIENSDSSPDIPFAKEFVLQETDPDYELINRSYIDDDNSWRNIDDEWLYGSGQLAIRLNSHINNTSLAIAIESNISKKVILLPGDAEYGSWESWHMIKAWDKKASDGKKHFVEDLLSRTVFYKVGHHLSYNGTALEKGIHMMPDTNMVAFATLDRKRISEGWKSTMPNKTLMDELIRRTDGRLFIMNEEDITDPPSHKFDPTTDKRYVCQMDDNKSGFLFKQYTIDFQL